MKKQKPTTTNCKESKIARKRTCELRPEGLSEKGLQSKGLKGVERSEKDTDILRFFTLASFKCSTFELLNHRKHGH